MQGSLPAPALIAVYMRSHVMTHWVTPWGTTPEDSRACISSCTMVLRCKHVMTVCNTLNLARLQNLERLAERVRCDGDLALGAVLLHIKRERLYEAEGYSHFGDFGPQLVHLKSDSLEWYTPEWILALIKEVFQGGRIDLDACSDAIAQQTVQAQAYFGLEQDGLKQIWHGRTYVNPPFGKVGLQSQQGLFLAKACAKQRAGHTTEILLLLKAAIGYQWFHDVLQLPHAFLNRKLSFCSTQPMNLGEVHAAHANPHGSVVVYLGNNVDRFCKVLPRWQAFRA